MMCCQSYITSVSMILGRIMLSKNLIVSHEIKSKKRHQGCTITATCFLSALLYYSLMIVVIEIPVALASSSFSSVNTGSTSTTVSSSFQEQIQQLDLYGTIPDPFAAASPLIVAAVCADGIAMVATHTVSTKETLLRDGTASVVVAADDDDDDDDMQSSNGKKMKPSTGTTTSTTIFSSNNNNWKDLHHDHGGPFRINIIDRLGTCVLSAGWRADCDILLAKLRSIASKEVAIFGPPKWGLPYGRQLAQEAVLWLAQCGISESLRPLSCVGLLAACADDHQNNKYGKCDGKVGSLWLIDITGTYRVRALAIGGGQLESNDSDKDKKEIQKGPTMVAQIVNEQLQRIDFSFLTAKEGVVEILKILNGKQETTTVDSSSNSSTIPRMLVPADCEIEMAVTVPRTKTRSSTSIQRLTLTSLIGQ